MRRSLGDRLEQKLFGRHSDGTTAIHLDRRRIYILPSKAGLTFALTLIVMLLGAINYNLALGHALVFLLAGIGLVGMIEGFRNLFGLVVTPLRSQPVFAGEIAEFECRIDNPATRPRLGLRIEADPAWPTDFSLPARDQKRLSILVPAERRGWLHLPAVRLCTYYPLGLYVAWSRLRPEMRCLVYPNPLATPLPPTRPSAHGTLDAGHGGQEDFAGLRDRQPADALRHVAWKQAARSDETKPLQIKEFSGGCSEELSLDWADTAHEPDIERRLSILAGWVVHADAQGTAYALDLPGCRLSAATGASHRQRCLEALALYER